jgi:hypothetical protein
MVQRLAHGSVARPAAHEAMVWSGDRGAVRWKADRHWPVASDANMDRFVLHRRHCAYLG